MDIVHHTEQARFVSEIEHQQAFLEYRLMPGHRIDFTFTFVPEELRGRGIAEQLVRTGLAWARDQGFDIQASCWYVRKFLR